MTDFVLEQGKKENTNNIRRFWNCENYANFIKQKPEILMFIPCDENGNVLEEPIETIGGVEMYSKRYQQAKERCLFEGFECEEIYEWGGSAARRLAMKSERARGSGSSGRASP